MSRTIFNKIPLTHYEYCKEVYNQIFDVPNNSNIFDEINNLIPKNDEPNFGKVLDETIRKTWREMEPAFVINQKYRQFSKLPFYLVGAEVTPSGSISRRDLIGGIAPHDVSKHWKMIPFGPGRKQRKLILIDSYHRGAVMEKETV